VNHEQLMFGDEGAAVLFVCRYVFPEFSMREQ
jgi:hypothetical protein